MTMTRTACILLLLGFLALGQEVAPPHFLVTGTVVDSVTGKGIKRVNLALIPSGSVSRAGFSTGGTRMSPRADAIVESTGDDGSFVLRVDKPGRYTLELEHPLYARSGVGLQALVINVQKDKPAANLRIPLERAGVLEGIVVDADGDPLERLMVHVYPYGAASNELSMFRDISGAATDDQGRFRIPGIVPGKYLLLAMRLGDEMMQRAAQPDQQGEAPTFYPSSTREKAEPVEVKAGETVGNLRITMRRERLVRVEGRIEGLPSPAASQGPADAFRGMVILMEGEAGSDAGASVGLGQLRSDGSFTVERVKPGRHTLMTVAMDPSNPGATQTTSEQVVIGANAETGLVIKARESRDVEVDFVAESGKLPDTKDLTLMGMVNARMPMPSVVSVPGTAGVRKLNMPRAGTLAFAVNGLPGSWRLSNIRSGDKSFAPEAVDLSQVGDKMTLVFAGNAEALRGVVQDGKDPVPFAIVVLENDTPSITSAITQGGTRTTLRADQNGEIVTEGPVFGTYKVLAIAPTQARFLSQLPQLPKEAISVKVEAGMQPLHLALTNIAPKLEN